MDEQDLGEIRELIAQATAHTQEQQWPEPTAAPTMPAPEGASASQFEPIVGRLERVAQMLESRADDQSAQWGRSGKVYENQSLGGLISQMPIPQAMGFVHQSWGLPSQSPGESGGDWQIPIPAPDETDRTGALPPVADLWPEPQATAPSGDASLPLPLPPGPSDPDAMPWFPDARPTHLGGTGKNTQVQLHPPGVIPGPDASAPAATTNNDDLRQSLESLRQSVEDLRQQMMSAATPTGGGAASAQPGGAMPTASTSQRSQSPAPPSARPTMPTSRDAHAGGMPTSWDQTRARVTGGG